MTGGERDPQVFAVRWAERVLRPGPLTAADRNDIERAIRRCYLSARMRPPAAVLWFAEPDAAARLVSDPPALVARLLAESLATSYVRVLRRLVRPLWALPTAVLLGMITGLLIVFFLLLAQALALWLVMLGGMLAAFVYASRRWGGGEQGASSRRRSVLVLTGALLITPAALVVLGVWADVLVNDVSDARWVDPATTVLSSAGALAFAVLAWRRGPAAHRAWLEGLIRPVDWRVTTSVLSRARRVRSHRVPDLDFAAAWAQVRADSVDRWVPRAVTPGVVAEWAWRSTGPDRALAAHETAARVAWRALRRLVVVVEPPLAVHAGPDGLGRWDGPAVEWPDGSVWYALRGVRLPRCPADGAWTVDEIHAVTNSEVRRVMIESIGWPEYLEQAEAELVSSAPDPGNPPHELALHEAPPVFGDGVRLLVMTNGSPDRSGTLRRYVETVPDRFDDPVEAAAWQYGVPVEVYRHVARRT